MMPHCKIIFTIKISQGSLTIFVIKCWDQGNCMPYIEAHTEPHLSKNEVVEFSATNAKSLVDFPCWYAPLMCYMIRLQISRQLTSDQLFSRLQSQRQQKLAKV